MHWFLKLCIIFFVLTLSGFFFVGVRPKLVPAIKVANTEKYGVIWQNEDWYGTIKISGDLISLPGIVVNVAPGTQILVLNHGDKFNLDAIPVHQKSGVNSSGLALEQIKPGEPFLDEGQKVSIRLSRFYANGTKNEPIIFTSDNANKSPYDFNKIAIAKGTMSFIYFSAFRRLEIGSYVTVRDSIFTDIGECALCITHGNPTILNNVFTKSLRDHIWVVNASPRIVNNLFLPVKGSAIVVDPKRKGYPQILNNQFQNPTGMAIHFLSGGEKEGAVVANNIFSAGDIKLPCDSKASILQNHIKSNIAFEKSGNCIGGYQLGLNYWEIFSQDQVVSARVTGTEPSFEVTLNGILRQPPKNIGRQ